MRAVLVALALLASTGCRQVFGLDDLPADGGTDIDARADAPSGAVTVGFAVASSLTDEAAGTHDVAVVLSAPSPAPVNVRYAILSGGSATRDQDYAVADGILTFPAGAVAQDIAIQILTDALVEPDETFSIGLSGPVGAQLGLASHTVTISANTLPRISFATSAISLSETVTAPAITVSLDTMSTVPIMVSYGVVVASTTATGGGVDYTLADGTLTISAQTLSGVIPLAIVNDTLDEDDEQIAIKLTMPINAVVGATAMMTYTIADDDPVPSVAFTAGATMVPESAGATGIAVSLSGPSGKFIAVPYSVTLGTASASDVSVANGTLTFPAGITTQSIPLVVLQDTLDEDDETLTLTLGTPTNATLGSVASDLVTITDDDPQPTVSITTASSSVAESVGTTNLTVALSAASGKPIMVSFVGSGTAIEGTDYAYAPAAHSLTFAPGTTTQTIAITVVEDSVDELDETVTTTLTSATNATLAGSPNTTTIIDDDASCYGPAGNYQVCLSVTPSTAVPLPPTLNTDTSGLCASSQPVGWTLHQPAACFVIGTTITVASGTVTLVTGSRPLVLVASDTIAIAGTLDVASHQGGTTGPGVNFGCGAYTVAPQGGGSGGGGGAGGSFMTTGGDGGLGGPNTPGTSLGADAFAPTALRGGCTGQVGGDGGGGNSAGTTGKGGGAVYLLAQNKIDLTGGVINASGSGAAGGDAIAGGSGAGAGGMIELFATTLSKDASTKLFANGGGGAGGGGPTTVGMNGSDPTTAISQSANGGGGGGGPGGRGFAGTNQAMSGNSAGNNHGGGGGGGGGGFIESNRSLSGAGVSAGVVNAP